MSTSPMTDPVQAMLAQTSLARNLFPSTSRYYGIATATIVGANGTPVAYLRRRFVPSPDSFQLLQTCTVTQGQRLDTIAAQYLGDPAGFWRIADANGALRPEDLLTPLGRTLRITLPQGITGSAL